MTLARPIRLVFCITELDPGGAERALSQLVLKLESGEWEPHVICLGPSGHYAEVLRAAKVPVVCLNATGVLSLPRVLYQLMRELHRLRPAIVQTYLFHANILGRIAARLVGVKRVVSGLRVAEHRSRWYGRIDRWTNGLVATNVCVSKGVADFSERVVGLRRSKLVVIPNAVDFERFEGVTPADLTPIGIPANSRVLISIGRLERQKGFDVLIDAIAFLSPLPADVYVLIVGEGPDFDKLRAQADSLQLSDRIRFSGRREDVPQLLAASTALILASRWEGMPNVVLEAMAASRPVIATQVEGIEELVRDCETGLTVPKDDPVELGKAIQRLLSDSEFSRTAGQRSQDICRKEFTTKSATDAYADLYRRLLEVPAK